MTFELTTIKIMTTICFVVKRMWCVCLASFGQNIFWGEGISMMHFWKLSRYMIKILFKKKENKVNVHQQHIYINHLKGFIFLTFKRKKNNIGIGNYNKDKLFCKKGIAYVHFWLTKRRLSITLVVKEIIIWYLMILQ